MRFLSHRIGNENEDRKSYCKGRGDMLRLLDEVIGQKKCTKALEKALEEELRRAPIRFFKTIIMPLISQNIKDMGPVGDGIVEWKPLVEIGNKGVADARAAAMKPPEPSTLKPARKSS